MPPFRLTYSSESEIELATINERAIAFIIDYALVYVFYLVVLFTAKDTTGFASLLYKLNIFPFLIYKTGMETATGTTVGKRLLNITVLDALHSPPSFMTIARRHLVYIVMAAVAFTYMMMFKIAVVNAFMSEHLSIKTINGIGLVVSKYLIHAFAFIDLVSISRDPEEQNRSLHDRLGGTLVVKIKTKAA